MESIGDVLAHPDRNIRFDGADLLTKKGYTLVPNMLLNDAKLSSSAKLAYVMLLKYAWEKEFCFPGQQKLADDMGVSERHVRASIKELEAHNFISVKRQGQGKASGIAEAIDEIDLNHLVTKQDLKTEIATLKSDVFKWIAPILIGQVAVFAAIVQVLG